MANWILVPCLGQLRTELNRIAPGRDTSSDGTIGDQAHADRTSSHNPDETGSVPVHDPDKINEVHAIDLDDDLRESDLTMEKVVQHILSRCRSGTERRLRNIIYNRRIWAASSGWVKQTYTGANAHDKHAHFEASYETEREASTASWHLEDIPVALTDADKVWLTAQIDKRADQMTADLAAEIEAAETRSNVLAAARVDDFLAVKTGDKAHAGRTVGDVLRDLSKLRGYLVGDGPDTANAAIPAGAPVARVVAAADEVLAADAAA